MSRASLIAFSKRGGKVASVCRSLRPGSPAARAQHPGAYRLPRHLSPTAHLAHACLLAVIKGKTERIAKGGKRPLGGVGLGAFQAQAHVLAPGLKLCLPLFLSPPAQ